MFGHFRKGLFLVIISSMLMSCAGKITYSYNNVGYETPEPALAAQKAELDTILSKITPTNHPIGGSAVVILPSISYVVKNFVVWRGNEPSQEMKEKAVNYHATILYNDWRARGKAVEKRQIFDRVVITNSDDPEKAAFNEDIALSLFKKDDKAQWFFKKKNSSSFMVIEEISTALPPIQRLILWIDNVEKIARAK
jgi:hypothetical protein